MLYGAVYHIIYYYGLSVFIEFIVQDNMLVIPSTNYLQRPSQTILVPILNNSQFTRDLPSSTLR